jgi:trafficking protein particle complex subunit 9
VDDIRVTLTDSASAILGESLTSKTLVEDEAMEIEHSLYRRPALLWMRPSDSSPYNASDASVDINIQIRGKRGLTDGSVAVRQTGPESTRLDCRPVQFHFNITVYPSLELVAYAFAPLSSGVGLAQWLDINDAIKRDRAFYLMILDIKNAWLKPLDLSFLTSDPAAPPGRIVRSFSAGETRRIVLTLPRGQLSSANFEMPLPRLRNDRQFVLPASANAAEMRTVRESWWHRQRILESLTAAWSEHGAGARNGGFELREIRLTKHDIEVIKQDAAEVVINVSPISDPLNLSIYRRVTVEIQNNEGNCTANISDR